MFLLHCAFSPVSWTLPLLTSASCSINNACKRRKKHGLSLHPLFSLLLLCFSWVVAFICVCMCFISCPASKHEQRSKSSSSSNKSSKSNSSLHHFLEVIPHEVLKWLAKGAVHLLLFLVPYLHRLQPTLNPKVRLAGFSFARSIAFLDAPRFVCRFSSVCLSCCSVSVTVGDVIDVASASPLPAPNPRLLRLYKIAAPRSNRQIVKNALTHVCLAGEAPQMVQRRLECLEEFDSSPAENFVILLRTRHALQFRSLYVLTFEHDRALRIYGSDGPSFIEPQQVDLFLKYDSASKSFHPLSTKSFSATTDAMILTDSAAKASLASSRASAKQTPNSSKPP